MPLSNLRLLRDDMKKNEKAVVVFRFTYKSYGYFVAVCLLTEEEQKKEPNKYALVRLRFMRVSNLDDYLDCYANSRRIIERYGRIREFFRVETQPDINCWIDSFLMFLGKRIPIKAPDNRNKDEHDAVIRTICHHENRDPNRIYRSHIFRNGKVNGKQKYRTEYNAQLAAVRFPHLYQLYKTDKIVSFAFTDDFSKEKSEEEILENFRKIDK